MAYIWTINGDIVSRKTKEIVQNVPLAFPLEHFTTSLDDQFRYLCVGMGPNGEMDRALCTTNQIDGMVYQEQSKPIDCVVGEWGVWTSCDKPCGGGTQKRTRSVLTARRNKGIECPPLEETQPCNQESCSVDCVVEYGAWGACSKTCGGGTQTRTGVVKVQPLNGGKACPPLTETRACNTQGCPVDCEVGEWSSCQNCSALCGGGTCTRTRKVIRESANGGKACPALSETIRCRTTHLCLNRGTFRPLIDWSGDRSKMYFKLDGYDKHQSFSISNVSTVRFDVYAGFYTSRGTTVTLKAPTEGHCPSITLAEQYCPANTTTNLQFVGSKSINVTGYCGVYMVYMFAWPSEGNFTYAQGTVTFS